NRTFVLPWRAALRLGLVVGALGVGAIGGYMLWKGGHIERAQAWTADWRERMTAFAPFPVQDVTVEGRRHVTQDAILKALDVRRGQSLLSVDLQTTRQRLERIEWVEFAAVERRWPDSVHVTLRERSAVALWQTETIGANGARATEYVLIDRLGRKVRAVDPAESQVRLILAGEAAPEHLAELLLLLQDARPIRARLRAAVFVGQRRWNLTLDDDLTIKLPADDAGAALQRLMALDRSDRLLARDLAVIDLRLPHMLVLRRRGAPDPLRTLPERAPARLESPPAPVPAAGAKPASPVAASKAPAPAAPAAKPGPPADGGRKAATGAGGQR
ncbi:MAG TPA: FtsQ-type POTRA domain-containing protein, partial [Vineibacter sp.]|nr:FtsQ-type POTRA domain-containing protein [Vineibacter sp.]